jgi:hypothetical protein
MESGSTEHPPKQASSAILQCLGIVIAIATLAIPFLAIPYFSTPRLDPLTPPGTTVLPTGDR